MFGKIITPHRSLLCFERIGISWPSSFPSKCIQFPFPHAFLFKSNSVANVSDSNNLTTLVIVLEGLTIISRGGSIHFWAARLPKLAMAFTFLLLALFSSILRLHKSQCVCIWAGFIDIHTVSKDREPVTDIFQISVEYPFPKQLGTQQTFQVMARSLKLLLTLRMVAHHRAVCVSVLWKWAMLYFYRMLNSSNLLSTRPASRNSLPVR